MESELIKENRVCIATRPDISNLFNNKETEFLTDFNTIVVLENYLPDKGLYSLTAGAAKGTNTKIVRIGISEIPQSGENEKVLNYRKLDAASLNLRIGSLL